MLAIVGRNGMGKTTLCNALTGLVAATGSVKLHGEEIRGLAAAPDHPARHRLRAAGAAGLAVAQRRRDAASRRARTGARSSASTRCSRASPSAAATAARELSGGEAQMLAIGRALLLEPKLLVMDEPTEGLAPMIVEQVVEALRGLAAESEIAVLLIEQNLGVAIDVADRDRRDGQRPHRARDGRRRARRRPRAAGATARTARRCRRRRRCSCDASCTSGGAADAGLHGAPRARRRRADARRRRAAHGARLQSLERRRNRRSGRRHRARSRGSDSADRARRVEVACHAERAGCGGRGHDGRRRWCSTSRSPRRSGRAAYVAGTFDTKGRELQFLRQRAREAGSARRHGRPRDLRQAVDRDSPPARGRAPPSRGRIGSLQRRPRQRSDRDGGRVRPLRPDAHRHRRADRRRRLGRHLARDQRHASACRSASRR